MLKPDAFDDEEIELGDAEPPRRTGGGVRVPPLVLIGVGIVLVAGIGLALWWFSQQDDVAFERELTDLLLFEEGQSLAADSDGVLVITDPGDPAWREVRAAQVQAGLANGLPLPEAMPIADRFALGDVRRINEVEAYADVTRDYLVGEDTLTFAVRQYYRLEPELGWVRVAPSPVVWEEIRGWEGERLRIVYYAPDEAVVQQLAPGLDTVLVSACEVWGGCADGITASLLLSNDPATFLEDALNNPRVVADVAQYLGEAYAGNVEYVWAVSPALAGTPVEEGGQRALGRWLAVRLTALLAETVGGSEGAPGLFAQALSDLGLDDANPGLVFAEAPVIVVEVTPPPTATPEPTATPAYPRYVVQQGDTLVRIALQFNTTIELILAFNDIASPESIFPGQELVIPPADAVPPTPTPQPTPTPTPTPTITPSPTPTPTPIPPGTIVEHTVAAGETLLFIADIYNTTVAGIVAENGLASADAIFAGQVLRVPINLLVLTPGP